jgi:uroporphyrin-III C-methyltransferase
MTLTDAITTAEKGKVYLVGAGPGSVDLLTLRAHALITSATCILHDDLVSPEILSLVSPTAHIVNVGKRCGAKTITQEQINNWMIQYAQESHSVVRLKSGDPLLFGRAAEELSALTEASIPFEIVPGVSAGFAAAALAGIPLTGRVTSSRVLFATRHLAAGSTNGLAGIAPEVTLILYMPGNNYSAIASELRSNGWPETTQCVLATSLGWESQDFRICALCDLAFEAPQPSPSLLIFFAPARTSVPVPAPFSDHDE